MGILSWLVLGLIVGIIAKFLMPGKDPGGFVITIILGIAGAFVGGFIGSRIGFGTVSGFDLRSLLIAVGGATLLLFIYRVFKKR
ncbi:MAG: GlsB/YeaQ/YmgE family stress response membrane protein [Deltaproteobacteria bacterium]|nr:GlsB/YeaQ/YmgE family stress response membrane protein [Deltaproteobacteria bacterium]